MQEPSRRGKRKLRSQWNLLIQWDLRTQSWTWDFGEKSGILEVCSAPVESGLCKVRNERGEWTAALGEAMPPSQRVCGFSIPGSVQGWELEQPGTVESSECTVGDERIFNSSQPKPIHDSWFLLTSQKSPRNEDQREEFHSQDFLGPPASQKMEDTSEGQDKNLITQWDEQWGADFKHWAFKNNKKKNNPGKAPVDYSGRTTWGSFFYSFILTHGQRQLQTPVSQISAAGPQVSITNHALRSGSSSCSGIFNSSWKQRSAEEKWLCHSRVKSEFI